MSFMSDAELDIPFMMYSYWDKDGVKYENGFCPETSVQYTRSFNRYIIPHLMKEYNGFGFSSSDCTALS